MRLARWSFLVVTWMVPVGDLRADEHVYVRSGDAHEWAVREAPLPEVTFGAVAARIFERRPAAAEAAEPPAYRPPVTLPVALDTSHARVAALLLHRSFTVGSEADSLRVFTLRARYLDGFVAAVNGTEIVRRNLAADASPDALAARTHGTEWESFYVSVPSGLVHAGPNDLTLEARPSAARLAPLVDVELSASDLGHIIRGPIVQRVGERSATVVFETDLPMLGEVRWGTAASSYDRRVSDGEAATRHALTLEGLPRDQEIHYQAAATMEPGAADDPSADFAFHVAPAAGEVVRFVVYGDVRGGHEVHGEITRAALGEAPDFVVSTGDMVQRGIDEADWQRYFAVSRDLLARIPVYPVIGNHDTGGGGEGAGRRLEDAFALPDRPEGCPPGAAWYSFEVGGVHVVILDSNRYEDERQLAWLRADLTAARAGGARAIFAAAHHGPYSRGPHGGEPTAAARYAPVLAAAGASLFFSGHDHLYERGEVGGLGYVVSGGGGAPLYAPRCGTPGKPACKPDGARMVVSVHHYVVVEVYRDYFTLCAKRPDGTPVEACVRQELPAPATTGTR